MASRGMTSIAVHKRCPQSSRICGRKSGQHRLEAQGPAAQVCGMMSKSQSTQSKATKTNRQRQLLASIPVEDWSTDHGHQRILQDHV
eukprot:4710043-Karenia_brevis.AAC.1